MSAGEGERRVCILTGASGTLGTDFCQRLSAVYDIAAVYRSRWPAVPSQAYQPFDPLRPEKVDPTPPVFAIKADLALEGECDRVIRTALDRFGRIDLLVNNAVSSTWAPMLGSPRLVESATAQMVTNVVVPLRLATSAARLYWQNRDEENRAANRNVVNVSSIAGLRLYPGSGQSVYAASKAALNHLTAHMAAEFQAIGVRVNATAANSFPSLVSTARATDAICRLDGSDANATVVVVDGEQDEVLQIGQYGWGADR